MTLQNVEKNPKKYFLIVGNGRTGTTYLSSTLDNLPDVKTDFEFVWRPTFKTFVPHHKVIPNKFMSVLAALRGEFSGCKKEANICGSKLVLQAVWQGPIEIRDLVLTIEPEISIIHISRDPIDTFFSSIKGFGHTMSGTKKSSVMINYLNSYDGNNTCVDRRTLKIFDAIYALISIRRNESFLKIFNETHNKYININYEDFSNRWGDICEFIGTTATKEERIAAFNSSVIKKNPAVSIEDIFENYEEIYKVVEVFGQGGFWTCFRKSILSYGVMFPIRFLLWRLYAFKSQLWLRKRLNLLKIKL